MASGSSAASHRPIQCEHPSGTRSVSAFICSFVNMAERLLAALVLYLQCTLCACGLCWRFFPCLVRLFTFLRFVATFSLGPSSFCLRCFLFDVTTRNTLP